MAGLNWTILPGLYPPQHISVLVWGRGDSRHPLDYHVAYLSEYDGIWFTGPYCYEVEVLAWSYLPEIPSELAKLKEPNAKA